MSVNINSYSIAHSQLVFLLSVLSKITSYCKLTETGNYFGIHFTNEWHNNIGLEVSYSYEVDEDFCSSRDYLHSDITLPATEDQLVKFLTKIKNSFEQNDIVDEADMEESDYLLVSKEHNDIIKSIDNTILSLTHNVKESSDSILDIGIPDWAFQNLIKECEKESEHNPYVVNSLKEVLRTTSL